MKSLSEYVYKQLKVTATYGIFEGPCISFVSEIDSEDECEEICILLNGYVEQIASKDILKIEVI